MSSEHDGYSMDLHIYIQNNNYPECSRKNDINDFEDAPFFYRSLRTTT